MTTTQAKSGTNERLLEREVEIPAPVETVWKALTDGQELQRWFPIKAGVKPGKGGFVMMSWGPDMEAENPIEVWEPNKHLRTVWHAPSPVDGTLTPLAVDFFLEGKGGSTALRVVHHGVGKEAAWDDMYKDFGNGWSAELRGLRHYLTHHRGRDRETLWLLAPSGLSVDETWKRLAGPEGLNLKGDMTKKREGEPYSFKTSTGDTFEGTVMYSNPPHEFAGTVAALENSMLRAGAYTCFGHVDAIVWINSWNAPRALLDGLESRLKKMLERAFPGAKAVKRTAEGAA